MVDRASWKILWESWLLTADEKLRYLWISIGQLRLVTVRLPNMPLKSGVSCSSDNGTSCVKKANTVLERR